MDKPVSDTLMMQTVVLAETELLSDVDAFWKHFTARWQQPKLNGNQIRPDENVVGWILSRSITCLKTLINN